VHITVLFVREPTDLLCVAFSPSVDVTYVVDRLAPGRIHRPDTVARVAGGKGLNVARAARALGTAVTATGIVGGHAGRWLDDALRADGVPAELVTGRAETRTCVSIMDTGAGLLSEVYEPATPVDAGEWAALAEVVAGHRGRWVTLSGSLPTGAPDAAAARLARAARDRGALVALDTHGTALADALDAVDVVKVNTAEAAALLGRAATDPRELAAALLGRVGTPWLAVVTAGADGAAAALREPGGVRVLHAGAPPTAAAFPVGSGDSFLAGLVTGLIADRSPAGVAAALRLAVATGTANAAVPGAAVFDRAEVTALLDRVRISP
jgi:1-phosphofructokinase family hexose kinase